MNYLLIVLGILVSILIYILYLYLTDAGQKLFKYQDIGDAPMSVAGSKLSAPASTRYAYGIWVYVNSWDSTMEKVIIQRAGFRVALESMSPTLKIDIPMSDNTSRSVIATTNFPLQKWTYVAVSVDNDVIDVYLDGKLVRSERAFKENVMVAQPPGKSAGINSGVFDAHIARFKRWPHPLNPQQVFNEYMRGSGQEPLITYYGVDVSLLRDQVEQARVSLF